MVASCAQGRKALRREAGPELSHMVVDWVRDLGADCTLGGARRTHQQRERNRSTVDAAQRVAQLPTGWSGRTAVTGGLCKARYTWAANITGLSGNAVRTLRHWTAYALTKGNKARKAAEVIFATLSPNTYLDPGESLTLSVLVVWAKRRVRNRTKYSGTVARSTAPSRSSRARRKYDARNRRKAGGGSLSSSMTRSSDSKAVSEASGRGS